MAELNSPQPMMDATTQALLAQMHDLQLPDPVTWWPLANSVWSLIVGILGLFIGLSWYYWVRHKNNRYRREALAQLKHALTDPKNQSPTQQIMILNRLLKQVAITHYGRARVAPLTGQAWVDFLQETAIYIDQPENLAENLQAGYQPLPISSLALKSCLDYGTAWIKGHHK